LELDRLAGVGEVCFGGVGAAAFEVEALFGGEVEALPDVDAADGAEVGAAADGLVPQSSCLLSPL
jgi:hypothetical protein